MEAKNVQNRNTFNVVCLIRKSRVQKNGEVPLFIRITNKGMVADIPVSRSVPISQWNQAKGKSNGKSREAMELNFTIDSMKSRLYQIHRELEVDGKPITAQIIKDIYIGNIPEEIGKTLVEIHTEHNERARKLIGTEYSISTIYKFDASLKLIREFMKSELYLEDIPLNQINEDFIRQYEVFLKTERGYCNNYTIKHLKIFKKVIRIAHANDWIQKNPFVTVKFRQDEVHIEFLTMEELEAIIYKPIPNKRLSQIRDVFIFCCFTGLAFVDVKNLRKGHIIKGNDGKSWIRKSREKTNNMCNIPLLQIPKSILEKYENCKECQLKEQLLPVPTNQKMNVYLKELSDICGINKRISSHVARYTFATSVTLANKVTMENVAKMLGHSSTRMTQHYARVLDQSISDDMMNVEKALGNINITF